MRVLFFRVGLPVGLSLLVTNVFAALPEAADLAFTATSQDVVDTFVAMWPLWTVVVTGFVLFKLFKRALREL